MKKGIKRIAMVAVVAIMAAVACVSMLACNQEKDILVVTREASSGTREAFDKYVGIAASDVVSTAEEYSSTGNVREKVASTATAIGYISLASVDDSVKKLTVEGVEATYDNVRNGSYKISRPFLLLTGNGVELQPAAQDFFDYCMSKTAEAAINAEKGITTSDFAERKEYAVPEAALSGTVVVKGSTSMEDMIKKLIAEYQKLGGDKVSGITFTTDFPGSGGGRTAAKEDTVGNVIGLASSAHADSGYTEHTLCLDAVAVIVNKDNNDISDVDKDSLKAIYTGTVTKYSKIGK
mgnify:FL=1